MTHWFGFFGLLSSFFLAGAASTHAPVAELLPGIPNLPDLVTVVPFYTKPNETPLEQTKAVIEAEIDGHRGVFIFDLGSEPMMLNRTYLQPNMSGGVDTVLHAALGTRIDLESRRWHTHFSRAQASLHSSRRRATPCKYGILLLPNSYGTGTEASGLFALGDLLVAE